LFTLGVPEIALFKQSHSAFLEASALCAGVAFCGNAATTEFAYDWHFAIIMSPFVNFFVEQGLLLFLVMSFAHGLDPGIPTDPDNCLTAAHILFMLNCVVPSMQQLQLETGAVFGAILVDCCAKPTKCLRIICSNLFIV
jgi:hypothetical protein